MICFLRPQSFFNGGPCSILKTKTNGGQSEDKIKFSKLNVWYLLKVPAQVESMTPDRMTE